MLTELIMHVCFVFSDFPELWRLMHSCANRPTLLIPWCLSGVDNRGGGLVVKRTRYNLGCNTKGRAFRSYSADQLSFVNCKAFRGILPTQEDCAALYLLIQTILRFISSRGRNIKSDEICISRMRHNKKKKNVLFLQPLFPSCPALNTYPVALSVFRHLINSRQRVRTTAYHPHATLCVGWQLFYPAVCPLSSFSPQETWWQIVSKFTFAYIRASDQVESTAYVGKELIFTVSMVN